MARDSLQASASDIRKFSLIQLVITTPFLGLVFWLFGGTGESFPPIWLVESLGDR